jgi:hypothetical protein
MQNLIKMSVSYPSKLFRLSSDEMVPLTRLDYATELIALTSLVGNCIMTNEMHKFFIYLSIYFNLKCFGLSFSPSSEAGVQLRQWFEYSGYGVSARALKP